jgi:DNA-binding winged helix-turn-helix (wHTH) protein
MLSMGEEIELLREQNRQLRALLADAPDDSYRKLGVSGMKSQLLGLLMKHGTVSRDLAMEALYGNRVDQPSQEVLRVMLCQLRKILNRNAADIQNIWNVGWFISPEHKKLIRELCA